MNRPSITLGILAQAWPILPGQLASMAYGVIDTMMTGHSSPADLAAMGLGASVYASVFVCLTGVVSALNPIIAHHYGARRVEAIGPSYVQGLWLALLLSAVGIPLLVFPEPWLAHIDTAPDVKVLVTQYLRLLSFAPPASLMFRATYAFNVAVSRPKVMMAVQVVGLVLRVALNYVLIFGQLGLPRLGAVGCGLASLIVSWALFLMGLVGGYLVGFRPVLGGPRGASGMWLMQSVALFLTLLLLLSFYLWVLKQQRPATGSMAR